MCSSDRFPVTIAYIADLTQSLQIGESFVLFGAPDTTQPTVTTTAMTTMWSTQTDLIVQALRNGAANILSDSQAILFQVKQASNGLPVGYLKYNWPGYFTTTPQATNVVLNFMDYDFTPIQIMDITDAIPTSTTTYTNSQLLTQSSQIAALQAQVAALQKT